MTAKPDDNVNHIIEITGGRPVPALDTAALAVVSANAFIRR